ncbi:hypothetical protein C8Q76DRAFT_861861 [Earliella scabrosa]|nr:hypothetical protein C8Q76DRAFT_861861 [Earliella scabrosa]
MSMQPFPRPLPLEIEERIIDGLQDSVATLRLCALVCRSWYIRSRYNLLRKITVTTVGDVDKLCTHFHVRPGLKSIVSELQIRLRVNSPRCQDIIWIPLARQLPRLCKLRLSGRGQRRDFPHISFHQTTLTGLRYSHPPVKTLELDYITLRSPQDLLRLLMALPSLRNLNLDGLRFVVVDQELVRQAIKRSSKKVNVTALNIVEPLLYPMSPLSGEPVSIPPDLNVERLRRVEFQFDSDHFNPGTDATVSTLQFGCDLVRTTRLGKLQGICFHFNEESSLDLYAWNREPAVLEKIASLEEVIISAPSKPKVTINIPSLKLQYAESIFKTAHRLFPRVDQGGNLFMSPTLRESLGRKGHQHPINALTISKDGLWAVSRSQDHKIILWNVHHQHTPIYHLEWHNDFADPVISPDSQFIAGWAEEGYLLLYNLQSPTSPLTKLVPPRNLSDHHDREHDHDHPPKETKEEKADSGAGSGMSPGAHLRMLPVSEADRMIHDAGSSATATVKVPMPREPERVRDESTVDGENQRQDADMEDAGYRGPTSAGVKDRGSR